MNNSLELIQTTIYSPEEFLGVDKISSLKLATEFLKRGKDENSITLLQKTIEGIFTEIIAKKIDSFKESNPLFILLNNLFNSDWEMETIELFFYYYFSNWSNEMLLDFLLESYLYSTEELSIYLATEKLIDYFEEVHVDRLSSLERAVYCCHVLNVSFQFHAKKDFKFNESDFLNYVTANLIQIIMSSEKAIGRLAIWAFFWLYGGRTEDINFTNHNIDTVKLLATFLADNYDWMTQLRLSVILLKTQKDIFDKIDTRSTLLWAKEIYHNKIIAKSQDAIKINYNEALEAVLINTLPFANKKWLEEFSIPALALIAGSKTLKLLQDNLRMNNDLTIKSAIILCGMGKLSPDEIIQHNLKYSDDLDKLIISNSGHLITKLQAKDTTGRLAYYFVLVEPENQDNFDAAIEGDGTIDLEDFGKVVASCYGERPTTEVKEFLKERYGFDV